MPKRGNQRGGGGGGRGGRGGGHSNSPRGGRGGRGGGRGGFGGFQPQQQNFEYQYDSDDDNLTFVGRNHQQRQKATEEDIYRRIQEAKGGRSSASPSGGRGGRATGGGFRPPPPPKQNSNGKNSKHFFWPYPEDNNNNNVTSSSGGNQQPQAPNGNRRAGRKGANNQMQFNRAATISDRSLRQRNNNDEDDSDLDSDEDSEEDDSSDDNIDRGCDSDEDSEDEILMNQFDWIEEDQQQQQQPQLKQQSQTSTTATTTTTTTTTTQRPQEQQQQRSSSTKKQHNSNDQAQRQTIVDLVSAYSMTPDHAMTQSEDFIQAMNCQGDLKVDADKITDLARPSSILSSISAHTIPTTTTTTTTITMRANEDTDEFGGMGLASQEAGIATGKEETMLWVMDAAPTPDVMIVTQTEQTLELVADDSISALSEKPKKKAHRSKRGGKKREKQLNKQFIEGHDDDGPMYLDELSDEDEEDKLAMEDYLQNTMGSDNSDQFDSLLDSLKGLHTGGQGHSKSAGGKHADDSDYEQQASELDSDDYEEDEFDFEEDYEDGIKKLDFSKVKESMNDKRKNRKADDLLREELRDLMPLWRSGALENGDGSFRPFKPRAKGYVFDESDEEFMMGGSVGGGKKNNKNKKEPHGGSFETLLDINRQIEDFVKNRTIDSLQLPPMPKPLRRKVHLLCNHYSLKSQSVGSGKRRFPILIKTDRTKMPLNPVNVNKLLNQSEKELT
ncbi:hypothetical protein BGX24_001822, partial [Mortierella sp. AD032]